MFISILEVFGPTCLITFKQEKEREIIIIIIIIIIIVTLARSLRCLTLLEVEDDPFSPSLTLTLANNILIF